MLLPVVAAVNDVLVVLSGFASLSFETVISGGSAALFDGVMEDPKLKIGGETDVGRALLAAEVMVLPDNGLLLKRLFVLVPEAGNEDMEAGVPLVMLEVLAPNEKIPLADADAGVEVGIGLAEVKDSDLPKILTDFGELPLSSFLGTDNCT